MDFSDIDLLLTTTKGHDQKIKFAARSLRRLERISSVRESEREDGVFGVRLIPGSQFFCLCMDTRDRECVYLIHEGGVGYTRTSLILLIRA